MTGVRWTAFGVLVVLGLACANGNNCDQEGAHRQVNRGDHTVAEKCEMKSGDTGLHWYPA